MQSTDIGRVLERQTSGRLTLDTEQWEDTAKGGPSETIGRQRTGGKRWVRIDQEREDTRVY